MKEIHVDRDYLETLSRELDELEARVQQLEDNARPTLPIYDSTNWPPEAVEGQIVIAPIV